MKQYHITSIQGNESGPLQESEVLTMLSDASIAPDDLCWTEGMTDWKPIREVLQGVPNIPPPLPPSLKKIVKTNNTEESPIFCTNCGEKNLEDNLKCTRCGHFLHRTPAVKPEVVTIDDSASMRMMLPVGRSGWAIASGYLGLFSVLLVFGPFALLTGILAVVDIRKHPEKHGMGRSIFGIIMGALGSIFLLIVLFSAATQT